MLQIATYKGRNLLDKRKKNNVDNCRQRNKLASYDIMD